MKKLIIVFLCLLFVVGCTSNKPEEKEPVAETPTKEEPTKEEPTKEEPKDNTKITICTTDEAFSSYSSAKQEFHSEGDIARKIFFEGTLVAPSKAQLDQALTQIDAGIETLNALDGIKLSYERIDDVTLLDKAEYDLELASISTLKEIGLISLTDSNPNAKLISVAQSVAALEASGFKCTSNK